MPNRSVPTLYEWLGGIEALSQLTTRFYEHVKNDALLGPVFTHMGADHPSHVAAFLAEVLGGPDTYSKQHGGHPQMIQHHLNRHLTQDQRRRWVGLLLETADELAMPDDPEFRSALVGYLEWGSRLAVINSQPGATVDQHAPMPKWGWGEVKGPYIKGVVLKTIGLIGGMSWESTVPYYRIINETVKEHLGGLHSAKVIIYSVDFHEVEQLQHAGDWETAGELLASAARSLEAAGADFLVLCTNTMHKVASAIEAAVTTPLLHIADPTADAIKAAGFSTVGLLGTRFTMEQGFYRDRLHERHGLQVLTPKLEDREIIHRVIYEELCLGAVIPASRTDYQRIMADLKRQGAEAIILGCTEISLLVGQEDSDVPLFDTTGIHARSAAERALHA